MPTPSCPTCGAPGASASCPRCRASRSAAPAAPAATTQSPSATPAQMRQVGIFFIVLGLIPALFADGYYISGLIPAPWFGWGVVAFGGWILWGGRPGAR